MVENRHFFIPLAFDARVRGVPVGISHPVWCGKTRMVWLPDGEKKIEDVFIRFDRIHERDGHTLSDRQTDSHRMTA